MSGNRKGKGRASRGKREQAASTSAGLFATGVPGARGSFAAAGRQRFYKGQDVLDMMTRSSSPVSPPASSSSGTGLESMSPSTSVLHTPKFEWVTPSISRPTRLDESAELFDHSFTKLSSMPDAQDLCGSEETMVVEDVEASGSTVPTPVEYCQVDSGDDEEEEPYDDDVTDPTWRLPRPQPQEEEEEEIESAPLETSVGATQGGRKKTTDTSLHAAANVSTPTHPVRPVSAVWAFFTLSTADPCVATCSVCKKLVRRGANVARLGTSTLKRHMESQHKFVWGQYLVQEKQRQGKSQSGRAVTPTAGPSSSHSRVTKSTRQAASAVGSDRGGAQYSFVAPSPSTSTCSTRTSLGQPTINEAFEAKRKFGPDNPKAMELNTLCAKMLAVQLLPFQLVESTAFKELFKAACPKWNIPSRHYFSGTALPALHSHTKGNVLRSLAHAVACKVHLTTDSWTSKYGQGRYLSFTAHWITLHVLPPGQGTGEEAALQLEMVTPPRVTAAASCGGYGAAAASCSAGSSTRLSSSPLASSTESLTETPPVSKKWRGSRLVAKRCHAVLELVNLGEESHSASNVLEALQRQRDKWLSPQQLQPGMVVCDNGANLVSALHTGKLTHVPCLAHVLNLVVQRFLKQFPGLPKLLDAVRNVCAHFRRSPTASNRLAQLQRKHNLPNTRVISDVATRWNSTLAMLKRLHTHQKAVDEYLADIGHRAGAPQGISCAQWRVIQDACQVLSPFEEATRMVSQDCACISDTIPFLFTLEDALRVTMDKALEAEQRQEEEDFLWAAGHPYPEDDPVVRPQTQVLEDDEEEDDVSAVGAECAATQPRVGVSETPALQRGWMESVPETVHLLEQEQDPNTSNLRRMATSILYSLKKDPRIVTIRNQDFYWLATLLDPRYKGKLSKLISPAEFHTRMQQLQASLVTALVRAFPESDRGVPRVGAHAEAPMGDRREEKGGCFSDSLHKFLSFESDTSTTQSSSARTHRQRMSSMVQEYIGACADLKVLTCEDPLNYWVLRLEQWPQLAQYALELLACPAASVLSERAFSAAGGFVTDYRVRLNAHSVDRLTFLKMNQSWIGNRYMVQDTDAAE